VGEKRIPLSFDIELTARCNNHCRHCYINLPADDPKAKAAELSLKEISDIADQAVALGAMWCLITGGEPLVRGDFPDIYMALKRKGLLVSVFTNCTLIENEHVELFRRFPPRDVEVSVYGVTKETYERVTRRKGSFDAFMRGLDRLLKSGVKVRLKAMALRSNAHEMPWIARFCRERTKDYFRFDPLLHLRFDGNPERNEEIKSERLSPKEIVALERADAERFNSLMKNCARLIDGENGHAGCNHLFHCGAGKDDFSLSWEGRFRLCSSLQHPACVYDLRKGSLGEAWRDFTPKVRDMRSDRREFTETCRKCKLIGLCLWCPAHAHLETGELDMPVDRFCEVAHARAEAIRESR
jgi:radical SAM protein with 4Fe4S-binding SPASM domain